MFVIAWLGAVLVERDGPHHSLTRQPSPLNVQVSFVAVAFTMTKDNLRVKRSKSLQSQHQDLL